MKKFYNLTLLMILMLSAQAFAGVKVTSLKFDKGRSQSGEVIVNLAEEPTDSPVLTVKDNIIQVAIPDSFVWPKIEKRATLNSNYDTTLMAYQFDKQTVRIRAMLPYSLEGKENGVAVMVKGKTIAIQFPVRPGVKKVTAVTPVTKNKNNNGNVEKYDESYLQKLLKDKESVPEVKLPGKSAGAFAAFGKKAVPQKSASTDEVKMALSGNKKSATSGFSMMGYIGKFVAFLALVLLLFYGAVTLMKKGVFKKGKLGFLNSTKAVEVINTTYLGPKRNLMLVRVHNQVVLIGNSEKGMHYMTEVRDVAGLMKDGEKALAGNNFDTSIVDADRKEKSFKLKEILNESNGNEGSEAAREGSLVQFLDESPVEDKVKLSDQIKNKVKGLKPLQ